MKKLTSLISAALLAAATLPAQANLINGDFSDGWTGWSGGVVDDPFTPVISEYTPPDLANLAYAADVFLLCNGQITGGGGGGGPGPGACSTSGGPPGENFARIDPAPTPWGIADLFQDFSLADNAKFLVFDYLWDPSFDDDVFNLFNGSIQDLNSPGDFIAFFDSDNAPVMGRRTTRIVDIADFAGRDNLLLVVVSLQRM